MFLQILPAAIVALTIAAALSAGVAMCRSERLREVLAPFAVGIAYLAGHFFITGRTPFPPVDTTNWLPYFALAAAAAGSLVALRDTIALRAVVSGLVGIAALRLLLAPKFRYGWSPVQGWVWVIGLTVLIILLALTARAIGRRSSLPFERPMLLSMVCGETAGALMLSGSLLLGQFATVLAAAVLGTLVLALLKRDSTHGSALCFAVLLVALLASGYFFASLPATSALLLAVTPAFALIPTGRIATYRAAAIRIFLVSVPIAIAVLMAFRSSPPIDY